MTDTAGKLLGVNDPVSFAFNGNVYATPAQSGVATFNLATPPPSSTPYSVVAGDLNYPSGAVMVTSFITVNPVVQTNLALIQGPPPGGVTLPNTLTVVVSPEQNGVVIKDGSTVTLKIYKSSSLVQTLSSVVDSSGRATFANISFNGGGLGAGSYLFTASDASDTSLSGNFTVNPAGLPKLVFAPPFPSTVPAGQATIPLTVDITDGAGNPLSVNDPLALAFNGGVYTASAQGGVATFNLVTPPPSSTPYQVEADDVNYASGAVMVTSFIAVNPPPAVTALVFGPAPSNIVTGQVINNPPIHVYVTQNGATINDNSWVTLYVNGNLSDVEQAINGVATFSHLQFAQTGVYTLTASDGSDVAPAPLSFSVSAPAVTTLVFPAQLPAYTISSGPLTPFQVWVEQNGQVINDNSLVSISVAIPNGAPLGGTTSVHAVNGVATFDDIYLGLAWPTTLEATDPGDVPGISNSFAVNPGAANYFSVSAPPTTTAGSSTIVTVDAQDITRNFTPNYTGDVTLTITDSQGNVVATPTATAQGGIATFGSIVLDKAGTYSLRATGTGAGGFGSAGLTVTAAAPTQLGFVQQPGTTVVSYPFAPPVAVAVEDQFGNVVTDDNFTNVSLSLAGGPAGAGLNGATIVQTLNGVATFTTVTVNQAGTSYTLSASDDAGDTIAMSNSFNIVAPTTIYVDQQATQGNNGKSWRDAFTSLQSALAAVVPGDTIDVAQGDYSPGSDPTATFQLIEDVTLQGGYPTGGEGGPDPAAYPTMLDGTGTNSHVLTSIGANSTAVLQGFTITGGNGADSRGFGAGMIVDGGSLAVSDCIFTANSAISGGGIYVNAGAFVTLNAVTISGNSAPSNFGTGSGGGIAIAGSAIVAVSNSTFSGNSAEFGGGIYEDSTGTLTLSNCTLNGNTGSSGGAIASDGSLIVINSTLSGNTASDGGGIYSTGSLIVTDSTISGNSGPFYFGFYVGGGIYSASGGSGTVNGTIIAGNTGYGGVPDDLAGNSVAGTYDLIGVDGTGSFSNGVDNNIVGVTPEQLLLDPLADNGGPTQTMSPLPGSPAIGAGSIFNGPDTLPIIIDQRGIPRPASAPDIGALQTFALTITANGINGADIYLESDGVGNLDWWVRNSAFTSNPLGNLSPDGTAAIAGLAAGVQVTGSNGNDVFTVDFSHGSPIPSGVLMLNGGTGTNSLTLKGTDSTSDIAISPSQVLWGASPITLSGISGVMLDSDAGQPVLLHSLTVNDAANVSLPASGGKVLRTSNLTINGAGTMNLGDGSFIVDADPAGPLPANVATSIGTWIRQGRLVAGLASPVCGLAAVLNDDGAGTTLFDSFAGQSSLTIRSILGEYTYNGDTDLDGKIDYIDYFNVDAGYRRGPGGYHNGDINYDGLINADDYYLIDAAFMGQTVVLAAQAAAKAAVPSVSAPAALAATPQWVTAIAAVSITPESLLPVASAGPVFPTPKDTLLFCDQSILDSI